MRDLIVNGQGASVQKQVCGNCLHTYYNKCQHAKYDIFPEFPSCPTFTLAPKISCAIHVKIYY